MTAGDGRGPDGFAADFPEDWYEQSDAGHFWMEWRLRVWLRRVRERGVNLAAEARAFDVGCGIGTFSRQVESVSGWTVDGADAGDAVARAPRGRGRLMALDIFSFPTELLGSYDHLFLFDVLEHLTDPGEFLRASLRYLKPGGLLHINVPALQSLYSVYDVEAGHHRRYDLEMMGSLVAGQGLGFVRTGYWGLSLLPYVLARKWLLRGAQDRENTIRRGFNPPGRVADWIVRTQMKAETGLFSSTVIGTSLMLTAQKEK